MFAERVTSTSWILYDIMHSTLIFSSRSRTRYDYTPGGHKHNILRHFSFVPEVWRYCWFVLYVLRVLFTSETYLMDCFWTMFILIFTRDIPLSIYCYILYFLYSKECCNTFQTNVIWKFVWSFMFGSPGS